MVGVRAFKDDMNKIDILKGNVGPSDVFTDVNWNNVLNSSNNNLNSQFLFHACFKSVKLGTYIFKWWDLNILTLLNINTCRFYNCGIQNLLIVVDTIEGAWGTPPPQKTQL